MELELNYGSKEYGNQVSILMEQQIATIKILGKLSSNYPFLKEAVEKVVRETENIAETVGYTSSPKRIRLKVVQENFGTIKHHVIKSVLQSLGSYRMELEKEALEIIENFDFYKSSQEESSRIIFGGKYV